MFWSTSLSDVKKGLKRDVIILYKLDTDTNRIQIASMQKKERKTGQKETTKNDYQCKDDVEMKKREKNRIERNHKKRLSMSSQTKRQKQKRLYQWKDVEMSQKKKEQEERDKVQNRKQKQTN